METFRVTKYLIRKELDRLGRELVPAKEGLDHIEKLILRELMTQHKNGLLNQKVPSQFVEQQDFSESWMMVYETRLNTLKQIKEAIETLTGELCKLLDVEHPNLPF
jgi:hypothetical protein